MKPASGTLISLLATNKFVFCDLYTITMVGGGVLRYTTADVDIAFGGNTWSSHQIQFDKLGQKALAHWKIGLDVDTWQVQATPLSPSVQIGSLGWLAAARAGFLDGAIVEVDRAYLAAWPVPWQAVVTPIGTVNIFTGRMASIDLGRSAAGLSINSHLELFTTQMPRNLFSGSCRHTLFDAGCTLSAGSYAYGGEVLTVFSQTEIGSNLGFPGGSGTFALGRVLFTSGLNSGLSRSVRAFAGVGGVFLFIAPLPATIQVGDFFTAYPGCDKQLTTCQAFGNQVNFGGEPYIPAPEQAT